MESNNYFVLTKFFYHHAGDIERKLLGICASTNNIELKQILKKLISKYISERCIYIKRVKKMQKTKDPKVIQRKELEKNL